jgi:EmrB/QacA subfamily drug resistance transporter
MEIPTSTSAQIGDQPPVASPPEEEAPGRSPTTETTLVVAIALLTMLAPLNSTMIVVALSLVIQEFRADVATAGWLVTSYLIVMASLQPVAGKLGDRLGRRKLILGGLLYFGVASLGAALAPNLAVLIFFRVQQAVAAAVALPNGFALVREVVPAGRRASRFGMIGAATAFAAAAGPPVGGLLAGVGGWRATFSVNVLLVVPALILGWRTIPRVRGEETSAPFDLSGAVLLSVGLAGIAGIIASTRWFHTPLVPSLGGIILAGVIGIFLWREYHHPDPVCQPRFFGRRSFAASNAGIAFSNLAMYSTLLAVPIFLRRSGMTPSEIGLVLASLSGTNLIAAPFGGRLADRLGRRWPSVIGMCALTVGLVPLAIVSSAIPLAGLIGCLALIGAGVGLSWAGLQTAAVESVGRRDAGAASGIFSTSRYLGSVVGSSVLGVILSVNHNSVGGFRIVFIMLFLAAALSAASSLFLRDQPAREAILPH